MTTLIFTLLLCISLFPLIVYRLLRSFSSVMLPTCLLTCFSSGSSSPLSPHGTLYHAEVLTASHAPPSNRPRPPTSTDGT
ncbi:hypothetical protein B0H13DRAFT_2005953, partial [Mycena leptocephala]